MATPFLLQGPNFSTTTQLLGAVDITVRAFGEPDFNHVAALDEFSALTAAVKAVNGQAGEVLETAMTTFRSEATALQELRDLGNGRVPRYREESLRSGGALGEALRATHHALVGFSDHRVRDLAEQPAIIPYVSGSAGRFSEKSAVLIRMNGALRAGARVLRNILAGGISFETHAALVASREQYAARTRESGTKSGPHPQASSLREETPITESSAPSIPSAETGLATLVDGDDLEIRTSGGKTFTLDGDVTGAPPIVDQNVFAAVPKEERFPLEVAPKLKRSALANAGEAIGQLYGQEGETFEDAWLTVEIWLASLFSGEASAPPERRSSLIKLMAQSVVAARVVLVQYLADSKARTVEEEAPEGIVVPDARPFRARIKEAELALEREQATRKSNRAILVMGGAEELSDILTELRARHPALLKQLAVDNPEVFGPDVLRLMDALRTILQQFRDMESAEEKLEYLVEAIDEGMVPAKYLRGRDTQKVSVPRPTTKYSGEAHWSHPLQSYNNGAKIAKRLAGRYSPESYSLENEINKVEKRIWRREWFSMTGANGKGTLAMGLSDLRGLKKTSPEQARVGLIRMKLFVTEQVVDRLLGAGLKEKYALLRTMVAKDLQEGRVAHAEALADLVFSEVAAIDKLETESEVVRQKLTVSGEEKAKADYIQITTELWRTGDLNSIRSINASIRRQTRRAETEAEIKVSQLTARLEQQMKTVVEMTRALGMLTDGTERTRLARLIPSVTEGLASGPTVTATVLHRLESLGLPVPGREGVPALAAGTSSGFIGDTGRPQLPATASGER